MNAILIAENKFGNEIEELEGLKTELIKRSDEIKKILYATPAQQLNELKTQTVEKLKSVNNDFNNPVFLDFLRSAKLQEKKLRSVLVKQKKEGGLLMIQLVNMDNEIDKLARAITRLKFKDVLNFS